MKKICVFAGSSSGKNQNYKLISELGQQLQTGFSFISVVAT